MLKLNHKNLDIWKASVQLVKEVYKLTSGYPQNEYYGLGAQLKRASVSVVSNIAEGLSRDTHLDTRRFLIIARSSLVEIDSQIEISLELKFCSHEEIQTIEELISRIFAMLTKMIKNFSK